MNCKNALCVVIFSLASLLLAGCTATGSDGDVADRECRTFDQTGSKMKRSVCRTTEQWAVIDAEAAEERADGNVDDLLRRTQEYNSQNPVSPGDVYDPYPAGF